MANVRFAQNVSLNRPPLIRQLTPSRFDESGCAIGVALVHPVQH